MPANFQSRAGNSRAGVLGAILLVLSMMLPVLFLTTPPLVDILGHMGRYELQTGLNRLPFLQSFYTFQWQVIGNLGADLVVELFHPLLGMVGATKLAVLMVPMISASAILLLSRELHGRITPFAIAALSLIFGLPFTWGFLNFSLAMSLALLAFVLWLRLDCGRLRTCLFVPVSLVIWLCHTFGFAFLGILCTAESLARRWQERTSLTGVLWGTVRDCAPLLAPLVPMMMWRSSASGVGIDGWFDFQQKAGWLISTLRLDWEWADKASAIALILVILAGIFSRRIAFSRPIAATAILAAVAYLLLPRQIFGSVFADMRLAPYVIMLALVSMRDVDLGLKSKRLLIFAALAFLGFRVALTTHIYREREQELEAQLTALQVIPDHARVATLVQIPCQTQWAMPWFSHIGSMALVRKHVFTNDQWANSSMNPLHVTFPAAGAYATDDRQLFFPKHCNMGPTLKQSLSALPARAFTHVWIVGVAPAAIPNRDGLTRIWQRDDAAVYEVGAPFIVE